MKSISLCLLLVMASSLSSLMAQSDASVDIRVSNAPYPLTLDEIARLRAEVGDDAAAFKGIMLAAELTNSGSVPLDHLTVQIYAMVSPVSTTQGEAGASYTVAKVFTFKNLEVSGGDTIQLHLGKVVLKDYTSSTSFGAGEEKGRYDGFIARIYQDGKCIAVKGSEHSALYTQVIEQGESSAAAAPEQATDNNAAMVGYAKR